MADTNPLDLDPKGDAAAAQNAEAKDPKAVLQNATDEAQAEIEESTRKQESYVYAAARAKVASENSNPPIDGDERTRTMTIADMNNAPTGIIPGMPGSQNPLAQALAKGDEDVTSAVEQVAATQAVNGDVPDGVQDANEAATTKNAQVSNDPAKPAGAAKPNNDPAKDVETKKAPALPKK